MEVWLSLMAGVAIVIIMIVAISVFRGVGRHRKLMDKMYSAAEREFERQLEEEPVGQHCGYCGAEVPSGDTCRKCGAPLD